MTQEALKLALDALECALSDHRPYIVQCKEAITAIKETLAQEQEPVALEAVYETIIQWDEGGGKRSRRELARRIVALYTTPPQRTEQEPVAWKLPDKNVVFWEDTKEVDEYHGFKPTIPLYLHPQRTWVGLTADEIWDEWLEQSKPERNTRNFVVAFTRAIEAKLKQKNHVAQETN